MSEPIMTPERGLGDRGGPRRCLGVWVLEAGVEPLQPNKERNTNCSGIILMPRKTTVE